MRIQRHTRGFSLLEVLIVIGVLAVVAAGTIGLLNGIGRGQHVLAVAEAIRADAVEMRTRARGGEARAWFGIVFATSSYSMISVSTTSATTTIRTELLPSGFAIAPVPTIVLFTPVRGTTEPRMLVLTGLHNAATSIVIESGGGVR